MNLMKTSHLLLVLFLKISLFITFPSCYYDNEEDLFPPDDCQLDQVTYSGDIIPILQQRCYNCHGPGQNQGNLNFEDYDGLQRIVGTGQLLGSVRHEAGFSPMPEGAGMIPECEIRKLEKWIEEGAPNN